MAPSPFDPYLPADVRRLYPVACKQGLPYAEPVAGAVLFADVSGFTALSERLLEKLGRAGAEVLTGILNGYFLRMIGLVEGRGGTVQKFGGDALTVLFAGEPAEAVERALGVAESMRQAMADFGSIDTPAGIFSLAMKIGIGAGTSRILLLGDPERHVDYVLEGAPVDDSADAEHHAAAGEIVLAPSAAALFPLPGEEREGGFVAEPRRAAPRATRLFAPLAPFAPESLPPADERFFPEPLRPRIASGDALLLNEHRRVACLFLRFPSADVSRPEILGRLQDFHLRVVEILSAYGGILAKIDFGDKGSKFLAVFGAPVALENCEEAAVRAAQEVARAARESVGEVAIGLNAGAVFAGDVGSPTRREYTVMGDTVNLSARLMQHAGLGRILASEEVHRAAPSVEWKGVDPFRVKGKDEPIRAAEPISRREVGIVGSAAAQVVPRPAVEAPIRERIDRLLGSGLGGVVAIVAPAGAGKSVLLDRMLEEAAGRALPVLRHRVRPFEAGVLFSLGRALATRLVGLDDDSSAGRKETRLRLALRGFEELGEADFEVFLRVLGWRAGSPAAPGDTPDELLGRVGLFATILEKLLGTERRVVAVDGAEALDFFSQRVLADLVGRPSPRLFLVASRVPVLDTGARIDLPQLEEEEVRHLLALRLGDERIDDRLVAFVFERSGGNLLYLVSLADQLRSSEAARFDFVRQAWVLDETRLAGASFESLEGLLLRRVDTLPDLPRRIAKTASILGDRFPEDLLRAIEPELPADDLAEGVRLLGTGGILERQEGWLAFPDSLLRTAICDSVPNDLRRRLHAAAARHLDRHHLELLGERAEQWHRAGRPARAIPLLVRAADRARRTLLPRTALLQLERVEEGWSALRDGQRSAQLASHRRKALLLEAELRILVGELDQARQILEAEVERDPLPSSHRFRALELLAQVALHQARLDAGLEPASRLVREAEAADDNEWLGRGLLLVGSFHARQGRFDLAEEELRGSVERLRRSRSREPLTRAFRGLGNCLYYQGRVAEATRTFQIAVAMARNSGQPTVLAGMLNNRAAAEMELGRLRQAGRSLDEAVRILRASGGGPLLSSSYSNLNSLAFARGNLAECVRWSRLHQECTSHLGSQAERVLSATFLADVFVLTGESAELERVLADIFGDTATEFDPQAIVDLAAKGARGLWEAGRREESVRILDRALARVAEDESPRRPLLVLMRSAIAGDGAPLDPEPAFESPFLEDRIWGLVARPDGDLDVAELEERGERTVDEAQKARCWLAVFENADLLARFSGSGRMRRRARERIVRLAGRLETPLWQRRAAFLAAGNLDAELPLVASLIRERRSATPSAKPRGGAAK